MSTQQSQDIPRERFAARYLDPVDRLIEIVYGVLIILTFTLAYRGIDAHYPLAVDVAEAASHRLLLAALGCTIAWGMIDAVIYVVTCLFERGQHQRLLYDVQHAPNQKDAQALIEAKLDDAFGDVLPEEERPAISRSLYGRAIAMPAHNARLTRDDIFGGIAIFFMAVVATLPVVIPFLLISDPIWAIRLSNIIAILMLFLLGYKWAQHTLVRPLYMGLGLAAVGLVITLIAIPLGG